MGETCCGKAGPSMLLGLLLASPGSTGQGMPAVFWDERDYMHCVTDISSCWKKFSLWKGENCSRCTHFEWGSSVGGNESFLVLVTGLTSGRGGGGHLSGGV